MSRIHIAGPADRPSTDDRGWGGRHQSQGAARGDAAADPWSAPAESGTPAVAVAARGARLGGLLQRLVTPLCIVAVAAAFTAEARFGDAATPYSAVAVVPVLVASMLRARRLTLTVVGFAILLQVWGVVAGLVERDQAGMQVAVYLLTLAVSALQQSRVSGVTVDNSPPSEPTADADADDVAAEETVTVPPLIHVSGMLVDSVPLAYELPMRVSQLLTRREREVVVLAVQGFTARQIGAQLFIGERTVETHLANAYGKLGIHSRAELGAHMAQN
jgi:DNA-binding CsgD family transcriptional regulator